VPCDLEERCGPVILCLLDAGVRFLIVGSWAVRFHGYTDRLVNDLDLLVELSADNWPRLIATLQHFGVSAKPFDELSQGTKPFQNKALDPVHFLTGIEGVSFEKAWYESVETSFGGGRTKLRVLSKAHVILSKEKSSRPQDAVDIKRLLEI
jgi:hypothetical protein